MTGLTLPAWADNADGRLLVEQIVAERPDYRLTLGLWIEGGDKRSYRGKAAGQLRGMFKAWREREFARLDGSDRAAADAVLLTEDGNELIERVLRETSERADLEPQELPDGRFQVAA